MKRRLITIAAVALVALLSACVASQPGGQGETPAPASPAPAESSAPASPLPPLPEGEAPLPESKPRPGLSEADATDMAKAMAAAAQLYYDKYSEQAEMITKNGFLYDFPSQEYMTGYFLTEGGELGARYANEPPYILFVRPEDLQSAAPGLNVPTGEAGKPVIFAACEMDGAFAVASAKEYCGVMPKDGMTALLSKYASFHGGAQRPGEGSDVYTAVENAVKAFRKDDSALDMRFLAADDKYAFVTCSPAGRPTDITEYALQKESGGWAVKLSDFQKEYQFRKFLTAALPDMSTALMPEFDLYFQLKYAKSSFEGVIDAVKAEGFITEDDGELTYISGTSDFIYAVYESGKKFVGRLTEEGQQEGGGPHWDIRPVQSYVDAEAFMKENDVAPPLFIVKQQ